MSIELNLSGKEQQFICTNLIQISWYTIAVWNTSLRTNESAKKKQTIQYIYIYSSNEKWASSDCSWKKKRKKKGGGGENEKRNGKNIREGASVIKVPVHRSSCAIKRVTWLSCSQVVPRRHTATYNETSYRDSQIWNNDKW